MKLIVVVAFLVASANCQLVDWGGCPKVTAMKPFDMKDFSGTWYEIKKLNGDPNERCVVHTFNVTDNTYKIDRMISDRTVATIQSNMAMSDSDLAKFDTYQSNLFIRLPQTLLILDTNYTSYAVMYTCRDLLGLSRFQQVWALSRDRMPSEADKMAIQDILDANELGRMPGFREINQADCNN